MRFQYLFITTVFLFSLVLTGCPASQPPANTNVANTSANAAKPGANTGLETVAEKKEDTVNQAETITPTVKAYCDAMTKRDEAALRKVWASSTLKYLEQRMKEDGIKSLVEYLETDKVSNKLCEVRNEKIDGDTAVAEIRTEGAPNGFKVKFVKEGSVWKMTNESPDLEGTKPAASAPAQK